MGTKRHAPRAGRIDPSRDSAKSLVVVTEGAETEVEYLKALRRWLRFGPNVKVVGPGGDPCSIVQLAAALRSDVTTRRRYRIPDYMEFDEAWAVFDTECDPDRSCKIAEAVILAHRLGVQVAASNPCFEFWLILHFVDHVAPIQTSKAAGKVLVRHFGGFTKSTPPVPTEQDLNSASARARAGRARHRDGDGDGNPSTNVDHLVASLIRAASPSVNVAADELFEYEEEDVPLVCGMKAGGSLNPRGV